MTEVARLIPREVIFGNPARTGVTISPDGNRLAYLAPVDGVLNLFVGDLEPESARQLTHNTDRPVGAYTWAFDNRHVLILEDTNGDENHHLHAVDTGTGRRWDLTPFPGARVEGIHLSASHPDEVLVGINARDPSWHDLHRVSLSGGGSELLRENDGHNSWLVDRELRVRGATRALDDGGWQLLLERDGNPVVALEFDGEHAMNSSVAGFGPSGTLYVLSSHGSDTNRLVRLDLESGGTEEITGDPAYDITGVELHPTTGELMTVRVTRARSELLHVSAVVARDYERLTTAGLGDPVLVSTDLGYGRWVVAFRSDTASTAYHLYDRQTGDLRRLFVEQPDLDAYELAPMEAFSYQARDGLAIEGYLTFPPGLGRRDLPAVVLVHGGPWGRVEWGLSGHAQQLSNRGYLVIQVNFRGSTGYGKAFVNAGDREWGARMNDDLVDAVRHLANLGYLDPDRVAVCGGSYGGYAALAALTFSPGVFSCAVAEHGPVNLVSLMEGIPPYWKALAAMLYRRVGHPVEDRDFLVERSPLTHVDRITAPLLLSYGANDPRVTSIEARQIDAALDRVGADYELVMFDDEGHGLSRPENRLRMYAASERFFARHLGGRYEEEAVPVPSEVAV